MNVISPNLIQVIFPGKPTGRHLIQSRCRTDQVLDNHVLSARCIKAIHGSNVTSHCRLMRIGQKLSTSRRERGASQVAARGARSVETQRVHSWVPGVVLVARSCMNQHHCPVVLPIPILKSAIWSSIFVPSQISTLRTTIQQQGPPTFPGPRQAQRAPTFQ